jgi:hypothetical protein
MHNYMLEDLVASTRAFLVFFLFLIPPGYLTGCLTNVLGFRSRSLLEKLLLSLMLSVGVAPGLAVLFGRFVSLTVALVIFVAMAVVFCILLVRDLRNRPAGTDLRASTSFKIASALVILWIVVAVFSLVDWQAGERLYVSVAAYDASTRSDFVEACVRTGVPPRNPFFFAHGSAPVMRYFYYWYVLCALTAKLAHVAGRATLIASSAWCGVALAATSALFLKHFLGIRKRLRRICVYAIGLIGVTGFDMLALWYLRWTPPDMEWWDPDQVTSWTDAFLWVPHHVASLIACLGGFLVLWWGTEAKTTRTTIIAALVAGFSFATAAGLSVYVVIGFALFMVLWIISLASERRWIVCRMCVIAGLAAVVFAAPYLRDLLGPGASGDGFINFNLPFFSPLAFWLTRHGLINSNSAFMLWRFPMLILHYVFELGFLSIVLVVQFVRDRRTPDSAQKAASWLMVASALSVTAFLRSSVIGANDLGWRAAMILQFMLLLWGAILLDEFVLTPRWNADWKRTLLTATSLIAILIGMAGTSFQLFWLRTCAWYSDQGKAGQIVWFPPPGIVGERTFEVRNVFDQLDHRLAVSAVLQHDPLLRDIVPYHLYSKHQFVAADPECGAAFGGSPEVCRDTVGVLAQLYRSAATLPAADLDRLCDDFHIDVLIAQEGDPSWGIANGWVWTRQPIAATRNVRAIPCGSRHDLRSLPVHSPLTKPAT